MPDTMTTDFAPNRSGQINEIAAALSKAQAVMSGAKKDSTNPHFKNRYADLESVWDAVRKPLTDNGLSVVQLPRTNGDGVEIETLLMHTSGQYLTGTLWVPASKRDAQGLGSAITYGRRYALMAICGIAPTDDDGNAAVASTPRDVDGPGSSWGNGGKAAAVDDAVRDGLTANAPARRGAEVARDTERAAKAKAKVNDAIATFRLSGQTAETLKAFWAANGRAFDWISDHMPEEFARLEAAYNEALDAARDRAA